MTLARGIALMGTLLAAACRHPAVAPPPDPASVDLVHAFADYFPEEMRDTAIRALRDTTTRCGYLTRWARDSSSVTRWHVVLERAATSSIVSIPPRNVTARGRAWNVSFVSTRDTMRVLDDFSWFGSWIEWRGASADTLLMHIGRPNWWLSVGLTAPDDRGRRRGMASVISDFSPPRPPKPHPLPWETVACASLLAG